MARNSAAGSANAQVIGRRRFVAGSGLALLAAAPLVRAAEATPKYRVAVIGHTGRGTYGHGLDRVWQDIPETRVVAVADADPKGLAGSVEALGDVKGFADYREMLTAVKPDLVAVAPRWLDQHRDMVVAAAEAQVRGIYLEKPMCRSLAEADEMVAACEKSGTKLAIAFQTRYSQKLPVVERLIADGLLGDVLEIRARGKEDSRGGAEDMWVLGTHMFNLVHHFAGAPLWCFGSVYQDGHPVTAADVHEGPEGIGPLAGDSVHAIYHMKNGLTAYFDSTRNGGGNPTRFGLQIYGSKGILQMFNTGHIPDIYYLADSSWSPGRSGALWSPVTSAGIGKPEPLENAGLHGGNVLAVRDLIASIEENRQPLADIHAARVAVEMIVAVFESHRLGGRVPFPLANRRNPLTMPGQAL
ncbi:MAG: Gfo/Idh/MocA family protein [Thermoguttaceae bacterium]